MVLYTGNLKIFHLVCQLSGLGDDYLQCRVVDGSRGMQAVQVVVEFWESEPVMGGAGVRDRQFSE